MFRRRRRGGILDVLSALGREACHKMSSPKAIAADMAIFVTGWMLMHTSHVTLTLYVILNKRGFVQFVGLEGVERRSVKPEGVLCGDHRNPLPPPVLLIVKRRYHLDGAQH